MHYGIFYSASSWVIITWIRIVTSVKSVPSFFYAFYKAVFFNWQFHIFRTAGIIYTSQSHAAWCKFLIHKDQIYCYLLDPAHDHNRQNNCKNWYRHYDPCCQAELAKAIIYKATYCQGYKSVRQQYAGSFQKCLCKSDLRADQSSFFLFHFFCSIKEGEFATKIPLPYAV